MNTHSSVRIANLGKSLNYGPLSRHHTDRAASSIKGAGLAKAMANQLRSVLQLCRSHAYGVHIIFAVYLRCRRWSRESEGKAAQGKDEVWLLELHGC